MGGGKATTHVPQFCGLHTRKEDLCKFAGDKV